MGRLFFVAPELPSQAATDASDRGHSRVRYTDSATAPDRLIRPRVLKVLSNCPASRSAAQL
jgi:hypothetical protein